MSGSPLKATQVITEIKRAEVRFVVALPDRTTSEHLLKPLLQNPDLKVVQVCKEDEGISICSGLYCTGTRAVLLIQHTGLLDSVNSLRGVAVEGKNPVCIIVGLLGKEPGVPPSKAKRIGIRAVEPILDAFGIEHHLLEEEKDISKIVPAVEKAYEQLAPVVLLIGGEPK